MRQHATSKSHVARAAHARAMCKHVRTHEGVGRDWQDEVVGAKSCVTSLFDSQGERTFSLM